MAVEPVRYRFNVEEYYRMAEAGIFGEDDRVELIEGEIVEMTPIGDPHALCVLRLNNVLAQRLQGRALINPQNPLRLDDFSEPQPDIVVVKPRRYDRHPRAEDVLLVIEVSDTSVRYDRQLTTPHS